jgi:hypothetical protein
MTGGTNGYVLQTDGTGNLSWTAQSGNGGNGTPGGANTQIQYNDAGSFGGNVGFTFNEVSGNVNLPNDLIVAGTIYGNFSGNSSNANYANFAGTAFNVSGSNVSGEVANAAYANAANTSNLATYATTANSVAGANVSGTVANATFALNAGNSNLANTANSVAGANVTGTVANATFATTAGSATTAGTVTTNAQPNITSVGSLTSLGVSGNITGANVAGGNLVSANFLNGTLTTAAQPNVTSLGTITSLVATTMKITPTTVAGLPSASSAGVGARRFITDGSTAPAPFGQVVVGAGSTPSPVYSDGTDWRIG